MSNKSDKLLPSIKRYFRCLWAALRGHDRYREERDELWLRVKEATKKMQDFDKIYDDLAKKWEQTLRKVDEQEKIIGTLQSEVNSYQRLVETLRTSISDKDHELTLQWQQYLELVDKQQK